MALIRGELVLIGLSCAEREEKRPLFAGIL